MHNFRTLPQGLGIEGSTIVLIILLCTLALSLWPKLKQKDLVFLAGALLTSILGIIPAKALFKSIANPAVGILLIQQIVTRLILPQGKWDRIWYAAILGPFLEHERLLLAFRSRLFQTGFVIALSGIATWFGSPINLVVCQLADFQVSALELAKMGALFTAIALFYLHFVKVKPAPHPKGNVIVPLGSIWVNKGRKEGEVFECSSLKHEIPDLLPLKKVKGTLFSGIRWYPVILLISGLIFAEAIQKSGLATKIALFTDHPLYFKAAVFSAVFGLSHFFPGVIVAALFFSLGVDPKLLIVAASSAFLSKSANDVNVLAFGMGSCHKRDFLKFGALLFLTCLIMELLWI